MYWTLRDSFEHWRSTTPAGDRAHPPDIVQAWERVRAKGEDFRALRARHYLGTPEADVSVSDSAFLVYGTQACQVGLALLLATLTTRAGVVGGAISEVAAALTDAINRALQSTASSGADRKLAMPQSVESPLNRIAEMNTARAVEFRYLWLELLCVAEARASFLDAVPTIDSESLLELRDTARARFTQQLIDERIAERRRYDRSLSRADLLTSVTIDVTGALESALEHWFDVTSEAFREWARATDFTVGDDGEGGDDGGDSEAAE